MAGTEFLLQPPGAAGVQVPQIQPLGKTNGAWASLLAIALIIGLLWAAKTILLPLALGIILAFTLSPLVRLFDHMRLPRFAGVALTMLLALGVVGGIGYVSAALFSGVLNGAAFVAMQNTFTKLGNDLRSIEPIFSFLVSLVTVLPATIGIMISTRLFTLPGFGPLPVDGSQSLALNESVARLCLVTERMRAAQRCRARSRFAVS